MYLTPDMLFRSFTVESKVTQLDSRGRQTLSWEPTATVQGIIADATPEEKFRWQQIQHPITHTITCQGAPVARAGDRLTGTDAAGKPKHYYIQGVDDPGGLGMWTLYHCEERTDK
jgi:hypothetical protein